MTQKGRTLTVYLAADTRKAQKDLSGFYKVLAGFSLAYVGRELVQFAAKATQAASDAREAWNKVNVVFGSSSRTITDFAKNASTQLGLTEGAALEAAGTFGNLLTAFGLGQDKAARMSETLVRLAGDLASFNNTSVEDAINALRSGLSGETEPLKRFGVTLLDTRLKAEAVALGFEKTTGALDPLVKAQAAYSLILQDTQNAQGDFLRTQDGLANTSRILSAAIGTATEKIGAGFVDAIENATSAMGGPGELADKIEETGQNTGDFVSGLGVIIDGLNKWAAQAFKAADGQEELNDKTEDALWLWGGGAVDTGFVDAVTDIGRESREAAENVGLWDYASRRAAEAQRLLAGNTRTATSAINMANAAYQRLLNSTGNQVLFNTVRAQLADQRRAREAAAEAAETTRSGYSGAAKSVDTAAKATERMANAQEKIKGQLSDIEKLQDAWEQAAKDAQAYADSISSAITGNVNLGSAMQAQLDDAAKPEGERAGTTWLDAFLGQIGDSRDFAAAMAELGSAPGVSEALLDQVAGAAKSVGPAAAAEIARGIAGTEGLAQQLSNEMALLFGEAGAVSGVFADEFYGEGVRNAASQLEGMKDKIAKSEKKLRKLGRKLGEPIADELTKTIRAAIAAAVSSAQATAASYPGASSRAAAAVPQLRSVGPTAVSFAGGGAGLAPVINITTGVGDPVAIAREIRSVLNQGGSRLGVA